ncbi:DUF1254 domain-containing protein [Vibrio sp. D404a]|uniref:DUF1254 domain-containing protein n=1 Tax=unclassified Vibrio TaxID=2614977 RepID=UPI002555808A|nr:MULTISPECIES: DUF1254 domain-containing protein [unclassified Vibrio]MDK9736904.1 DUF1254 domain-containing protein [Vibrio sp. D404a]MDK9795678.1 DUF1254 domain-containing protein [Vibrio sp. D449a]
MKKTLLAITIVAASCGAIASDAVTTSLPNGTEITATPAEMRAYIVTHHANYLKDTVIDNGGTNIIKHTRELPGSGTDFVVTPALDHLYSKAVLDLSDGPVFMQVPVVEDRYFSVHITDQEHYTIYDEYNPKQTNYMFVREGSDYKAQDDVIVVESRGNHPHVFLRTQVFEADTISESHAIQDQVAIQAVTTGGGLDFSDPIKFTLDTSSVYPENLELMKSRVGKHSDAEFKRMQNFMTGVYLERSIAEGADNWGLFGPIDSNEPRADDHVTRVIGIVGHLGLPVYSATMDAEHAYYTGVPSNCEGKPLNGSKTEVFTMPYEPGVDLFWSLTRYSGITYNTIPGADHQVYNAYNTQPDKNGNITITFSTDDPQDGSYWMPVNEGEPYYFVERYYGPRMAELKTILQRCD